MNVSRLACIGSAAMLAALAGCDTHQDTMPAPRTSVADGTPRLTLAGETETLSTLPGDATVAGERPHKSGAFGAGIRPGRGASGIVP
jgi:hypothetical protein